MPKTPSSPKPDGPKQATIRARTRTNPVRSEVIDALDELERSLGDVSRWEQLLTGRESAVDWERPGSKPPNLARHFGPNHLIAGEEDDGELDGDAAVALEEAIRNLDDRIEGIRNDAPMLQAPVLAPAPDGAPYEAAVPLLIAPSSPRPQLLQTARTVDPGSRRPVATPEQEDEIDRRRRNGRMLTWVGLALLVALGGFFFLPKSDDGDPEAPTVTVTTPTTAAFVTAPLLPTEDTSVPVVPIDLVTTSTAPAKSTKKATPTTKAVVTPGTQAPTPSTVPATQPPLVQPGPSTTVAPVTSTTEVPVPETTTTAAAAP